MGRDLREILDKPTCSVEDLRGILSLSKNHAYQAVRRGDFPSIRIGRCFRVLTAPLRRRLGIEPPADDVGVK
jgi:hypothetical protein